MSWWQGTVWGALAVALGESDKELKRREMEQVAPTYPGIVGVCARCLDLQAAYEQAVVANGELEEACEKMRGERDTAHKTIAGHEQTIAELSQQLRDQFNEHLRMDRGIYRADGFDTGSRD